MKNILRLFFVFFFAALGFTANSNAQITSITEQQLEVNLLKNGGFENGKVGWKCFKSAAAARPTDGMTFGTGQSVSLSTTALNPLKGKVSGILTKPASNVQGEGCYYDFTLSEGDLIKVFQVVADYKVLSGTFAAGTNSTSPTDSDVIFYLYDKDSNKIIEPSTFKLFSNLKDEFKSNFQTGPINKNLRLIVYFATTSTQAFTLALDTVGVSKSKYVYGTPITDWVPWTPTGSWTANTIYTGKRRQVGDVKEYQVWLSMSGTPTATQLLINLPGGDSIDTSKLASGSTTGFGSVLPFSNVTFYPSSGWFGTAKLQSTTAIQIWYADGASNANQVTNVLPQSFGAGTSISISFSVPIVGLSSSVQMSESNEGKTITSNISWSGTQTLPSAASTKVPLNTVLTDTGGTTDSVNNRIYIRTSGFYTLFGKVNFVAPNTSIGRIQVHFILNGNSASPLDSGMQILGGVSGNNYNLGYTSPKLYLKSGDYIELYTVHEWGSSANLTSAMLGVTKDQGSSAIAATEPIAAVYNNSSGQSFPSGPSANVIIGWTRVVDTHLAMNPTTGVFTAPAAGLYELNAVITTTNTAASGDRQYIVNLNTSTAITTILLPNLATSSNGSGQSSQLVTAMTRMNAGDTLSISLQQNSGSAQVLNTPAAKNVLTIKRIGL